MLPELLEQDHRKQTGAGPAPGDHMERRRILADLLAVPAGELLADMLNHIPLARRHLLMLDMLGNWPIREAFQMAERRIDFSSIDPIKALFWSAVINGFVAVP